MSKSRGENVRNKSIVGELFRAGAEGYEVGGKEGARRGPADTAHLRGLEAWRVAKWLRGERGYWAVIKSFF